MRNGLFEPTHHVTGTEHGIQKGMSVVDLVVKVEKKSKQIYHSQKLSVFILLQISSERKDRAA